MRLAQRDENEMSPLWLVELKKGRGPVLWVLGKERKGLVAVPSLFNYALECHSGLRHEKIEGWWGIYVLEKQDVSS
eukprot:1011732-Pelagomonas_calceolata.AAC.4